MKHQFPVLSSSVISFPDRGPYGQSAYRGNTSGYPIEAFLRMFHPDPRELFVDPTLRSSYLLAEDQRRSAPVSGMRSEDLQSTAGLACNVEAA